MMPRPYPTTESQLRNVLQQWELLLTLTDAELAQQPWRPYLTHWREELKFAMMLLPPTDHLNRGIS